MFRARRRSQKARARLAAPDEELVAKPSGMHNKTFVKLGRDYLKAVEEWRACYHEWGLELAEYTSRHIEAMEREKIKYDL